MEALQEFGGRASSREVLDWIERQHQGKFEGEDLKIDGSGSVSWRHRVHAEVDKMRKQGVLRPSKAKGLWELPSEDV